MAELNRSKQLADISPDFLEGFNLAIALLRDVEEGDVDSSSPYGLDAEFRKPGKPQTNIVLTYLKAAAGNDQREAGFAAVLSDYLSSVAEGAVPDWDFYEKYLPNHPGIPNNHGTT